MDRVSDSEGEVDVDVDDVDESSFMGLDPDDASSAAGTGLGGHNPSRVTSSEATSQANSKRTSVASQNGADSGRP